MSVVVDNDGEASTQSSLFCRVRAIANTGYQLKPGQF